MPVVRAGLGPGPDQHGCSPETRVLPGAPGAPGSRVCRAALPQSPTSPHPRGPSSGACPCQPGPRQEAVWTGLHFHCRLSAAGVPCMRAGLVLSAEGLCGTKRPALPRGRGGSSCLTGAFPPPSDWNYSRGPLGSRRCPQRVLGRRPARSCRRLLLIELRLRTHAVGLFLWRALTHAPLTAWCLGTFPVSSLGPLTAACWAHPLHHDGAGWRWAPTGGQ